MSSRRKKISEKKVIANSFKHIARVAPIKDDEESKLIEQLLDVCTKNGSAVLIAKANAKKMEMASNVALKPRTADGLASLLAGVIVRVANEVGDSPDWFIGKIVEKVGYFTEELLSGEMLKRMEEEKNGKDDTGVA